MKKYKICFIEEVYGKDIYKVHLFGRKRKSLFLVSRKLAINSCDTFCPYYPYPCIEEGEKEFPCKAISKQIEKYRRLFPINRERVMRILEVL